MDFPQEATGEFSQLARLRIRAHRGGMILPEGPVTLSAQQVAELNQKLSTMRHDINNSLALVLAGVELMRIKPDSIPRMLGTIGEQPNRITALMKQFSGELEEALNIRRSDKVH